MSMMSIVNIQKSFKSMTMMARLVRPIAMVGVQASYLNNQTGDSYNYLTNQSGSVIGLTKDRQAVASTSYHLYGTRKTSTDPTAQPFVYNGEDCDDTGLDYLRARYYDSQGGTFLTEDSYSYEDTEPLSQNRYSYVQNNPVNYTDPSVHFWNSIKKAGTMLKRRYLMHGMVKNILMEEMNNEYKSNSFKKKRTL